jgi:hypothetical protein
VSTRHKALVLANQDQMHVLLPGSFGTPPFVMSVAKRLVNCGSSERQVSLALDPGPLRVQPDSWCLASLDRVAYICEAEASVSGIDVGRIHSDRSLSVCGCIHSG